MSDSETAGRIRLLKPDTRHLNTAGKRNHLHHPFGVDQSRPLCVRIFTQRNGSVSKEITDVDDGVPGIISLVHLTAKAPSPNIHIDYVYFYKSRMDSQLPPSDDYLYVDVEYPASHFSLILKTTTGFRGTPLS
jgi:hypothetical protein